MYLESGFLGEVNYLYLVRGGCSGFDIKVAAPPPDHLAVVDSY